MNRINRSALFLAGVRKCGTTTLFDMLARHSKISPASFKESQFFACDPDTVKSNLTWYLQLFEQDEGSVLLDGSTWYFGAEDAPNLIRDCIPDSSIILSLRDPAQRVFSGYLHMKKQAPTKEQRSFEDIIAGLESLIGDGYSLIEAEKILLEQAVNSKLTDADYINTDFHSSRFSAPFSTHLSDPRFSFRYFTESCYSAWLPRWESVFGDRLKIVFFEDLMQQPATVIEDILRFSSLDLEENVTVLSKKNETRIPTSKFAEKLLAIRKDTNVGGFMADILKSLGLRSFGQKIRKDWLYGDKERATPQAMEKARALLTDEYAYWGQRDSRTKTLWSFPREF